jgi:hypothetical protein
MQLSIEGNRFSGLRRFHHPAAQIIRHSAAMVQSVRVLKTPGDFLILVGVASTYWLVAAIIWQQMLYPLVCGIHQVAELKVAFAILGIVGAMVLVTESAELFLAAHTASHKSVVVAAEAIIAAATLYYWFDAQLFAGLYDRVANHPSAELISIADNIFLLMVNVILPVLGGRFVLRLVRRLAARQRLASR